MTKEYFIILKGKDKSAEIEHCSLEDENLKVVFKNNPQIYTYQKENFMLVKKATSYKLFNYLKELCTLSEMQTPEGSLNMLLKEYGRIQTIPKQSALSLYLNPSSLKQDCVNESPLIFPFGTNKSQYEAVQNAMCSQISVIEGPPGTGKTQTILNIIANLICQNKTIAMLSNNNSATQNVFEKLESYGFGFVCATLGKKDNKESFIINQSGTYPSFDMPTIETTKLKAQLANLNQKALESFHLTNELAKQKAFLNALRLEYEYFKTQENTSLLKIKNSTKLTSEKILKAKVQIEQRQNLSFWLKLKLIFLDKVGDFRFYKASLKEILHTLDSYYYELKSLEFSQSIETLQSMLQTMQQENPVQKLKEHSLLLLKSHLKTKYQNKQQRVRFELSDLSQNAKTFLQEYPVILSTTHSIKSSLNLKDTLFDYVIIDEASQVDLVTGFLALSSAKNAIIVGDTKQLPNVISQDKKPLIESLTRKYHIPLHYDFLAQSLLSSIIATLPNVSKVMLKEHYRCHPKIIGFCNKKFYNNELIILSEDKGENDVIQAFITQKGNHARGHYNQREIDVIIKEILPPLQEKLTKEQIGIISPFRKQKAHLQESVGGLEIDTIHKYQGQEKEAIILSTVENEISDFINDVNLLNVAISRAKRFLRIVISAQICESKSHLKDLIAYMQYHNFEITQSKVKSIFDLLYKANAEARRKYLKGKKRISAYDSENLAYHKLKECISPYGNLDIATHIPLHRIINITQSLSEQETKFVQSSSHIDLLIFNTMDKLPVLAIEVDGFSYHKEDSKQSKRDEIKNAILQKCGIPLLRLSTIGSDEIGRVKEYLDKINFQ
ncbi:DUF2726 domain-containing protein [Campylobacter sp. MIT 21-1685]|uniref:DUF2726 domain-containing protein n=1 Tax=unclassified Campylobacter TaxID=2593542 RepID=UPI00224B2754|nr:MULTISPECIES: AAA domain-containing protein [unclassified Campylobacter]MCX2683754.1 DUF2726 domain-containing protein [Campylobacter sp. MIT 21-1684]MCX2752038.1 DUF2726 domain-containing protein [Campylobacter sp. MIT 21-1682]MCX2808236.1 DUF2726 domain-containing protein [Campylobacter sp. MIT 21-1685]